MGGWVERLFSKKVISQPSVITGTRPSSHLCLFSHVLIPLASPTILWLLVSVLPSVAAPGDPGGLPGPLDNVTRMLWLCFYNVHFILPSICSLPTHLFSCGQLLVSQIDLFDGSFLCH